MKTIVDVNSVEKSYGSRNAVILLSYPVNRKAMLGTKCLVVSVITMVSAFISNTLVMGIMYVSAHIFGIATNGYRALNGIEKMEV